MDEGNIVPFCILVFMAINLFAMSGAQQNIPKTSSGDVQDKEQSMFKLTDSLIKDLIERVNQLEEENRQRQLEISEQNRIILQQQHEINGLKKNMATQVENQYQPDKADVSSMLTEYYDENGSQLNEELSQSANTGPDSGTTGIASHKKTCIRGFANNKCSDQPAYPRSLISTFVIRFFERIISRLAKSEISNF